MWAEGLTIFPSAGLYSDLPLDGHSPLSLVLFVFFFLLLFYPGCYPYYDKDPFILEKCPHVYFVGNQPKYASKVLHGKLTNYNILSYN